MEDEQQQTSLFDLEPETITASDSSLSMTHVAPLAAQMRPKNLDNYVGQQHILANDSPT